MAATAVGVELGVVVAAAFVVAAGVLAVVVAVVTPELTGAADVPALVATGAVEAVACEEGACETPTLGGVAGAGDADGKVRLALEWPAAALDWPGIVPCDGTVGAFCTPPLVGGCEIWRPARFPPVAAGGV